MSLNQLQDFYKVTITSNTGAGAGKIYVSTKPTPTNGYIVASPTNASKREIIRYTGTGTDGGGDFVTVADVADRGLGGTVAQVHISGESVRMNMTSEHWADLITEMMNKLSTSPDFPDTDALKAYIDGISINGGAPASTSVLGITRLSYSPNVSLGNCTITIASPAVITKVAHGLTVNDIVIFATTGTLPTGLVAGTKYYVLSAGLTSDDFQVSISAGGAPVDTSGTQGGTQSVTKATPIAVSPNDPIFAGMPTASQKDAMAGKSGSPVGSFNKFVDEASLYSGNSIDQSQTQQNTALKVGEADATGKQNIIAQSFVAGKVPLKNITLWKKANTGTFAGDVVVSIQADNAGSPSGTPLASVTILNATYNGFSSEAPFVASLSSALVLQLGVTYWIVVDPSTSDNSNYLNLGYQNSDVYASGVLKYRNTTDGWASLTGDLYFVTDIQVSGKVPVVGSDNKLPEELRDIMSMLALENITAQDAIAIGLSSSGVVAFDAKASKASGATSGNNWADSQNITVGNNPNRVIIVVITCQSSGGGSGVDVSTIGGVAPTQIFSHASTGTNGGQFHIKAFRVVNPSVGVNAVVFGAPNNGQARSGVMIAYSLYNVDQSSPIGNSGINCVWSTYSAQSVASSVAGGMVLGGALQSDNSIPTSGINIPLQQDTGNSSLSSGGIGWRVGLSNTIFPASTNDYGIPNTGGFPASFGIEVKPASSTVPTGAVKASANENTVPLNQLNGQASFVGFARETKSSGVSIKVSMERIVGGFSNLVAGLRYYLQNTAGAIGLVPGTVTKMVGVALSSTELLVKTEPVPSTPIALSSANGTYLAGNDGFIVAISANATTQMTIVVGGVTHSVQSSANNTQRELVVPVQKGQSYTITNSSSSYFIHKA